MSRDPEHSIFLCLDMLAASPSFPDPPADLLDRGITICDRRDLGLASLLVRKDLSAALAYRLCEHFAIELPKRARRASAGPIALASIRPGGWLVSCENGHRIFATSLAEAMGDLAAVCDQSDGYAVLRLCGAPVPRVLSKLVPVDLDARAFQPNDVATTVAAHITVVLWRLPEINGSPPLFELAIPRSLRVSFWDALLASALDS